MAKALAAYLHQRHLLSTLSQHAIVSLLSPADARLHRFARDCLELACCTLSMSVRLSPDVTYHEAELPCKRRL